MNRDTAFVAGAVGIGAGFLGFLAGTRHAQATPASAGALKPGNVLMDATAIASPGLLSLPGPAQEAKESFRWRQWAIRRFNALPFPYREAVLYQFILPRRVPWQYFSATPVPDRTDPAPAADFLSEPEYRQLGSWETETAIRFFDANHCDVAALARIYADVVARLPTPALRPLDRLVVAWMGVIDMLRTTPPENVNAAVGCLDLCTVYHWRGYTFLSRLPAPRKRDPNDPNERLPQYLRPCD